MGKTSSAVKNRWNAKTYDRICVTVPKGYGDRLKDFSKAHGETVNVTVMREVNRRMERKD